MADADKPVYKILHTDDTSKLSYLDSEKILGFRFPNMVNCVAVVLVPNNGNPDHYMAWHCSGATLRQLQEISNVRPPENYEDEHVAILKAFQNAQSHGKIKIWGCEVTSKIKRLLGADEASRVYRRKKFLDVLYTIDPSGDPEKDKVEFSQSDEKWSEYSSR